MLKDRYYPKIVQEFFQLLIQFNVKEYRRFYPS